MIEPSVMVRTHSPVLPALVPIPEVSRQWGGLGKTATYALIERHGVQIIRIGGRAAVAAADVLRVVDELTAASKAAKPVKGGRVLAASSVEARRAKRSKP